MIEPTERPLFTPDATPATGEMYDTANLTGRQIGRYLIGRRLGSGGAAAVYQAYDQVQGRSVALKVLLPGADEIVRTRFRQEARTAAALRHPNIVTTLQVGDAPADGVAYIAMELIEGESLARLLERRGRLLPEESCNLLTPIARALAHAHRAGVVHRDVKPSNILLRPVSPGAPGSVQLEALDHPVVPLLSDFGIARALDTPELTNAGRTIGTPAYMAPEQCAGSRDVTAQSDIYSLGAVLYRCLVGRAPFLGSTTQILYAHVYESVTIPDDILAALPPRVVDVLRATLAKEPTERYLNALELADALTLAAGRALPTTQDDAAIAEATSTLTLSSLGAVGPVPPPQRTETVIVASSASGATRAQNVVAQPVIPVTVAPPSAPIARAAAAPATATPLPPRRPWMRFAAGLAGVLALVVMGAVLISAGSIFPFERIFGPGAEIPVTSQPLVLRPTATPNAVALAATATPGVNPASPTPTAAEPTATGSTPVPAIVGPEATDTATATNTPVPTPAPTETPTVPPTATPVLEPTPMPTEELTAEPTEEPTLTPTPTATPDALTVACQYVAMEELYNYLLQEGRAQTFGCATDQGRAIDFEVQPFQNGLMLRRSDIQAIYAYFAGNGQWEQHPDRWTAEMPPLVANPELAPPSPGLFQPERGIGLLWAENTVLRGTLGWATAPATATNGVVQTFDGGLLIRDTQASSEVIYEFLKSLFRF